jgi:type I restriction enzyme, S subunit
MSEWRKVKLSDLGEVNRGRSRFRPRNSPHLYGGSYPFIQTGDIKQANGKITSHSQTYNQAGLAQSKLWPANTMVITIAANIAETAILSYPACFPDSVIGFIANPEKADVRFIEYLFRFHKSTIQHENVGTGSVQDNINLQTINRLTLCVPELPEQKAIARILSSLDDKIELNRRMNETLESMARAIFKDWFVDFGPTRAKQEGRDAYLPEHLWSLFPEAIDLDTGLPQGWKFELIGNIANITSGKRPSKRESQKSSDCQIPLYGGAGQMAWVAEPLYQHSILITGRVGTLGLVHRIEEPSWPSDNTLVIVSRDPMLFDYLYFFLNEVDFLTFNRGSTQPLITQTDLKKLEIIKPDYKLSSHFSLLAASLMSKIKNHTLESRTLAELRDRLLPKLMSGEIRVKDAEQMVEEVM